MRQTNRQIILLLLSVYFLTCLTFANPGGRSKRFKREPLQQRDEATEERTNRVDIEDPVEIILRPAGRIVRNEGDNIQFECRIKNKPTGGQVQWYYIVRGDEGHSFENFTIIANEAATVDNNKFHVWTRAPSTYSLRISNLRPSDKGEYCCFLFVTYSETYRKIAFLQVNSADNNRQANRQKSDSKIDAIIEKAVEHDIEEELGKKLNITLIKNNKDAKTLIHNATEEIKSLLNLEDSSGVQFQNDTTKLIVTRKMRGMSSQVKTVVTSLIRKISTVDSTLADALKPKSSRRQDSMSSGAIRDWRKLYNEYKKQQESAGSEQNEDTDYDDYEDEQSYDSNEMSREGQHEQDIIEFSRPHSSKKKTRKCEYQLVINEFDPSQCPSVSGNKPTHAAAMYYEADNRQMANLEAANVGNKVPNEQLTRLENRLMDEMVNSKVVNKTVTMHDSMLQKTEAMLKEQTGNLTKLEDLVVELKGKLQKSEEEKESMDQKLTEVMINMLEVNKRLDVAMKAPRTAVYSKQIGVESITETVRCDRHPNVTHYKDCADAATAGSKDSGVYYIRPLYSACPIPVWCDMDTYPGGWTVFQRREGGTVNFNKIWNEYRRGFGKVTGEHWLGNDNLFMLTNQAEYMLRVDLWDFYNSRVFSEYRTFKIDGERDDYKLTVGNYSGTAGNGLKSHINHKFSTPDRDHDTWEDYHCAYEWEGGWWFTNCWSSYLNGAYHNVSNPPYNGISWREWKEEQLFKSEMKIRPVYHVAPEPNEQASSEESEESVEETEESEFAQQDEPRHKARHHVRPRYNKAHRMPPVG